MVTRVQRLAVLQGDGTEPSKGLVIEKYLQDYIIKFCYLLHVGGHLVPSRFCLEFCCSYLIVNIIPVNILSLFNEKGSKITQLRFKVKSDVLCKTRVQTWQNKLWSKVELRTKM